MINEDKAKKKYVADIKNRIYEIEEDIKKIKSESFVNVGFGKIDISIDDNLQTVFIDITEESAKRIIKQLAVKALLNKIEKLEIDIKKIKNHGKK